MSTLALIVVGASAVRADDPFAPTGTEGIWVRIGDRGDLDQLRDLGLDPEERRGDEIALRVTPDGLRAIETLGLPTRPWTYDLPPDGQRMPFTTYAQMVAELETIATNHPTLTRLAIHGQSVQGRDIYGIKVTANPGMEEVEPEVRVVGAHHGNERMSVEMCMNLAELLTSSYGFDDEITQLVNTREIWIVPMVNPDGVEADSRYNAHSVDLNRNYGYMWDGAGSAPFSEPETRAMHDLATDNWFVLSLSFHCSGDIVNSVWNYTPTYTEDDDVVTTLSDAYAAFNGYWSVRGWYWYETHGDCNDWSYGARSDIDWTIEVDNFNEANVWSQNRDAILMIIDAAGWGIHGVVTDADTGAPVRARVWVEGNGWPAFTDPVAGDYHKPLMAGTYDLRASANGYDDVVVTGVVVPDGDGVTVNVSLPSATGHYADRLELANVADPTDSYDNPTLTMSMLGQPDGIGCSLGRGGDATLDLGTGSEVIDTAGPDLMIYESSEDASSEGYTVYAGDTYLGPWTLLGTGLGTTAFDLAGTGLTTARYVQIVDDGDGSASGTYPGFEMDGLEVLSDMVSVPGGAPSSGSLAILAVRPNPMVAGRTARLWYALPEAGHPLLHIVDVTGRSVVSLDQGSRGAGVHVARWDGRDSRRRSAAPGVYFLRLDVDGGTAAARVLVLP